MVYLAVGCGGVLGAILRFLVDQLLSATALPPTSGILVVNLAGCFIIGFFLSLRSERFPPLFRVGFSTGFLGAFTTFSTFSVQALDLFLKMDMKASAVYVALTVLAGFGCVQIGHSLALRMERKS